MNKEVNRLVESHAKLKKENAALQDRLDAVKPLPNKWRSQKSKPDEIGLLVECTRNNCARELDKALKQEPSGE